MTKIFDSYLRTHRRRWALSQDELGLLLGHKTGSTVSQIESDRREPSLKVAYAFEVIFGIAAIELFPGLHQRAETEVLHRTRELYDALQGESSTINRLKLDFFEDVFSRAEARHQNQTI